MVCFLHAGSSKAEMTDAGAVEHMKRAIDTYERALRENPGDKQSVQMLMDNCERMHKEHPQDPAALKLLGIAYHTLAAQKMNGATKKALECLEKAHALDPYDAETLAYLGSAMTMSARDSWNVVSKVSRVNKGLNMLDTAVGKSPSSLPLRMVRGSNAMALPSMFNRRDVALKDFLYVEGVLSKKGQWNEHEKNLASSIFYRIGMIYRAKGDTQHGREYLGKAAKTAPGSFWAGLAKKQLSS